MNNVGNIESKMEHHATQGNESTFEDKGLRTFSWSCFLYGQPLACSVFYRAFPAQRLFDPRMVVPVDVFAGEADDLLARTLLPMLGIHGLDLHTAEEPLGCVCSMELWPVEHRVSVQLSGGF